MRDARLDEIVKATVGLDPESQGNVQTLADDDRQKAERMFLLIFQAVAEIAPNFQVVVTDHADLRNCLEFQQAIIEKIRGDDNALIPSDWT